MRQLAIPPSGSKAIVGRGRLEWSGNALRRVGGPIVLRITPDLIWPSMWRVQLPNGRTTAMVNRTRARDAAEALALSLLVENEVQDSAKDGRPCAKGVGGSTAPRRA
jgi:hypothetical protein